MTKNRYLQHSRHHPPLAISASYYHSSAVNCNEEKDKDNKKEEGSGDKEDSGSFKDMLRKMQEEGEGDGKNASDKTLDDEEGDKEEQGVTGGCL